MPFTRPLPPLPPTQRRTQPADVSRRHAPADWQFAPLTASQCQALAEFEAAAYAGTLRGLPTCFGALS